MLELFCANIQGLEAVAEALPLSAYRREKLRQITNAQVLRQSLGAELLLIQAVRTLRPDAPLPLEIAVGDHGKPELIMDGLHFNLSHSGSRLLCGLSDSPLGVDVQQASPFRQALARRFFTEREYRSLLEEGDGGYAFTRLWCLKESYLKWLGQGLDRQLDTFELVFSDGEPRVEDDAGCRLRHWTEDSFHFALCASDKDSEISLQQLELP